MQIVPSFLALALAALWSPGAVNGQPSRANIALRVDSLVARFLDDGPSSVSIALTRGRDTVVLKTWGIADRAKAAPATANTLYRIASVTKQFTAVAVLRLMEQGKISLSDTIGKYLAGRLPAGWGRPTISQLLNHTGGIPDYNDVSDAWLRRLKDPFPPDTELAAIARRRPKLDFTPGTRSHYSNVGYNMLGMLIEQQYGRPYARVIEDLVRPLGLTATHYCEDAAGSSGQAMGYQTAPSYKAAIYEPISHAFADGSLCATAADLTTWTRALHGGGVLTPASYSMMTTPQGAAVADQYGFGVLIGPIAERPAFFHTGGMAGFESMTAWIPSDSVAISMLVNTEGAANGQLATDLVRIALGLPVTIPPKVVIDPASLAPFIGTYILRRDPNTFVIHIRVEAGRLISEVVGQEPALLRAMSPTKFQVVRDPSLTLEFIVTNGVVERIDCVEAGNTYKAFKRP